MSQRNTLMLGIAVLALAVAGTATAQILDGATPPIELNFSTPGARSLAMGGAFVGLADDATAAFTNPAGLVTLRSQEVGLELRDWKYTFKYPYAGHYGAAPSGLGTDTVDGLVLGESSDSVNGLSFLSYVYAGEGWALALYDHKLADFKSSFLTAGPFVGDGGRLFPVRGNMDLKIQNYGASVAFTASETFSVGLGVSYYDFSFDAFTDRYDIDITSADAFYGPPDYSPGNLYSTQSAKGTGNDWGYTLGLLWKASPKVWFGAVYRNEPKFDFTYSGVCGPSEPDVCVAAQNEFTAKGSLNIPTVYAVGLALKPNDALTVTLDYDRVQYSKLEEGFTAFPSLQSEFPSFSVKDANEYHVGLEYGFLTMKSPLLLRAGAWLDPSHAIKYSGQDLFIQALWSAANAAGDQWHYTGGLGIALANGKLELDAAADISDRVDTYSLSGVYRF